ncbi:hypothetical protein [Robiginitomaculum antarcticum]|uniref:hypothetical protein n=1 Tax=Robiginitomaculum antarcticum TaxID=437507 RepID=UPI00035D8532|nr:hypothetical protein [Robiginitomaculum antarcticum]
MRKTLSGLMGVAAMMLPACATVPDPAKVCTAQWIAPRVDRAVTEIKRETGSVLRTITRSAKSMEDGKISAWNTYRMISAGEKYIDRLKNSRGLNDLRILSETCDDPHIIRKGFADYLQSLDAPPMLIDMVRDTDYFQFDDPRANPDLPRS